MPRLTAKDKARLVAGVLGCMGFVQFTSLMGDLLTFGDNRSTRSLAVNLGNGSCAWSAPTTIDLNTSVHSTLFAAYPGSGKRLSWLMIEALTGNVVGDDWDLSLHGNHVVALKSGYPHNEGTWNWGDEMDQVVLQVRSPRWALQSYLTIRDELEYSESWWPSFFRRKYVYTLRPDVSIWEQWRDENFDREIEEYGKYIDFWMEEGYTSEDGGAPTQDPHCQTDLADCFPKAVLSFESMNDPVLGPSEVEKIAVALGENRSDVNMIAREAWECVYHETIAQPFLRYNPDRAGPPTESRFFTVPQLNTMVAELNRLKTKYSNPPWDTNPIAQELAGYLTTYITEIDAEIAATTT